MTEFVKKKKFGQNFLTSPEVPKKIAAACGVDKSYGVLEVGPGKGILTKELAAIAKKVCAVEIDTELKPFLDMIILENNNINVLYDDILKIDINKLIDMEFSGMSVSVCANLPYYITTPILMYLLERTDKIDSITIMVQKEVAERLCSKPGTPEYGAITAAVNYYSDIKKLFNVPAGCFTPKPKVDSSVIQLKIKKEKNPKPADEKLMFSIIAAAFGQRRKTFVNALYSFYNGTKSKDVFTDILAKLGYSPDIRGERLSIYDFCIISNHLSGI